ncbi:hypothetical protein ACFXNW_28960 [Nocardia sp. NPDC059180]|uniref:hypothetical protein n=1 Tax=Nocardia sp. NPDC059180 TaxID=3346761 RepID=UPI0036B5396D
MAEKTKARRRAYALWTDEKNTELVEMLRAQVPLEEICERTGGSPNAIGQHCMEMIPASYSGVTAKRAFEFLPVLLADPNYDWREPLRELRRATRSIYWDPDMDATLRQGWADAVPLEELAVELGASEIEIGRRLIGFGLAETMTEVVDRLGFGEDDTLSGRLRVAADREAAAVWVLIVDNVAAGGHPTMFGEAGPAKRYVSVHADADRAARELSEVVADHLRAGGRVQDLTTAIVERTAGDRHIGKSIFATGDELSAAAEATGQALVPVVDLDALLEEHTPTTEVVDLDAIGVAASARPKPRPRRFWRRR